MITTRISAFRLPAGVSFFATMTRAVANVCTTQWSVWRNRRRLKGLDDLDDHLLADIGLTREDLIAARRLPVVVDPTLRLAAVVREHQAATLDLALARPRGRRGDTAHRSRP